MTRKTLSVMKNPLYGIGVATRLTIREAWRRKLLWIGIGLGLVYVALFSVGFYFAYRDFMLHQDDASMGINAFISFVSIFLTAGLYVVNFLVVALTALTTVGAVSSEIDTHTIHALAAKPVRRWQILGMASNLMEDVCRTFERERQPETLREASSFLNQLTDGKYTRIWTPLGTNKLKIDGEGKSLPLEVLSRGTREAVFIALRLSLAAAYARRGVMLPLVLDPAFAPE